MQIAIAGQSIVYGVPDPAQAKCRPATEAPGAAVFKTLNQVGFAVMADAAGYAAAFLAREGRCAEGGC